MKIRSNARHDEQGEADETNDILSSFSLSLFLDEKEHEDERRDHRRETLTSPLACRCVTFVPPSTGSLPMFFSLVSHVLCRAWTLRPRSLSGCEALLVLVQCLLLSILVWEILSQELRIHCFSRFFSAKSNNQGQGETESALTSERKNSLSTSFTLICQWTSDGH